LTLAPDEAGSPAVWPRRKECHSAMPAHLKPLVWAEDAMQYLVAAVLLGAAAVVLIRSIYQAIVGEHSLAVALPNLIDSVLFTVIVLEIFTTVLHHFRRGGFQLKPFLMIGIVSAVRHLLIVGAESSLGGNTDFHRSAAELELNTAIVLALVVALVLVERFARHEAEGDE
jgi:uncharacterized membrane protein (DUF373 family)